MSVTDFERAFSEWSGAKYCVALCNGTATLHTALVAMGVGPGSRVVVPPLTMSSTTIAVLHAGGAPVFADVDPSTWLIDPWRMNEANGDAAIPVSLYGLHCPYALGPKIIDDAAQTLRKHAGAAFTSWSFQASKVLSLSEGGMLGTDDEALALRAREFSSLGYRMRADQPRIDKNVIKSPDYARHHSLGWNYRMSDLVAAEGLKQLARTDALLADRRRAAEMYHDAIGGGSQWGCSWITPQAVPEGFSHDYWSYAVALDTPERWYQLADAIVKHGGTKPFSAWRLTYHEPAFRYLEHDEQWRRVGKAEWAPRNSLDRPPIPPPLCPVAESLQPRIMAFQTNNLADAERNARALRLAIQENDG